MNLLLTPKTAPHLALGVTSHATKDECLAGFAKRSRVIKNTVDSPFSIQDLTTALSEVETQSDSDVLVLRYSVPCDQSVYQPKMELTVNGTTYSSTSDLSSLDVNALTPQERDRASIVLLSAAIHQFLEWQWDTASDYARECLRLSRNENERDEALNVLAATWAMKGDAPKALDALKKAVEGEWNLPLQVNLAIIATEEDPSLAVAQMSHLVAGGSTVGDQLNATRLAIQLWRKVQGEETGSDDDEDFEPLPRSLLSSVYELLKSPAIREEDFFSLGLFLARVDAVEFEASNVLSTAHHRDSPSAEIIRLRLQGFEPYLEGMSGIAAKDPNHTRPWIHTHIDDLIIEVNSRLSDDDDNQFAPLLAFTLLSNGLDCTTFHRIAIRLLVIRLLRSMLDDDALPNQLFIDWVVEADHAINDPAISLIDEQRELLREMKIPIGNFLGLIFHRGLVTQGVKIEELANGIASRMGGVLRRMSADKEQVRKAVFFVMDTCAKSVTTYDKLIPLVADAELKEEMLKFRRIYETIRTSVTRYYVPPK